MTCPPVCHSQGITRLKPLSRIYDHWSPLGILASGLSALLSLGLFFSAPRANAQQAAEFGKTITLSSEASIIVMQLNPAEFRSQYPAEFSAEDEPLIAYELRFGECRPDLVYCFYTDRANPTNSDVVLLCGTQRVNILKVGSAVSKKPRPYTFGLPGFYQTKDRRWGALASGGEAPLVIFFTRPKECGADTVRLLVQITVSLAGKDTNHSLLFGQPPAEPARNN